MTLLTNNRFIGLKKSPNLIEDLQACGINTLMTFLDSVSTNHKVTIEDLKQIFEYNADGISLQKYRFNKFNNILKDNQIPYKVYPGAFNSHQELLKHLDRLPVPVVFSMRVIEFIREKFKYSQRTINLGDEQALFNSPNHHILLLVGYEGAGDKLYFIDPVYQLPYYSEKDLSNKVKSCVLDPKQFYECAKGIKAFFEFRYMEKLERHFKTEKNKRKEKEKQRKLL